MIVRKRGRGVINTLINKLPFELHIPGYQYCGPGTKLKKRLARGDSGINPLDVACKEHDIAYSKNREDIEARNSADRILAEKAWRRVLAEDSSIGERTAAYTITNAMKLKSKLGMGVRRVRKTGMKKKKSCKKRFISMKQIMKAASLKSPSTSSAPIVIHEALNNARKAIKKIGGKKNVKIPRILSIPRKVGGALPFLIPLFAGLSAAGALAGGAAGVVKAVNNVKAASKQLEESKRHNKKMEELALGKGLYLKPYKVGLGLYFKPYKRKGLRKKKISK